MTYNQAMNSSGAGFAAFAGRRALMLGVLSSGLLSAFIPAALADKLSCLPPAKAVREPYSRAGQ